MDYPSNSHSKKGKEDPPPEPKNVEKVTSGEVVQRKKPLGKRIAETFVGGDAKGVWNFVAFDVLIPAAKDMLSEAVSQGVERMLFGEVRGSRGRGGGRPTGPSGYVSYNKFAQSGGRREEPRASMSRTGRATHNFDEIILEKRVDAEEVIDRLFDLVSRYEVASVGDLYDLVGIESKFTDEKWGWTDIRDAGVSRVRNGYLLNLPRPEPLD